jgi:hypothetical protein
MKHFWKLFFYFLKNFALPSPCGIQSDLKLFEPDMHSNGRPPVTLRNNKPGGWILYARIIDQSKADIFIKPGIMLFIGFVFE